MHSQINTDRIIDEIPFTFHCYKNDLTRHYPNINDTCVKLLTVWAKTGLYGLDITLGWASLVGNGLRHLMD
jgi:hypothetical protein